MPLRRPALVAILALVLAAIAPACACCRWASLGTKRGAASWYGPGFHGRRMANGRRFDRNARTAASRILPLGTIVEVTNLANGRMEVVTICDRGPYVRGRLIDLSEGTARRLGFLHHGLATVTVTPIGCDEDAGRYRAA